MTSKPLGAVAESTDRMVRIARTFDAPRELVFAAWSDAERLRRWFAPAGCELARCTLDFRVGGTLLTCIRTPAHGDCWCVGTFREIVAPERIVYSSALCDEAGNKVESTGAGKDPDWPSETIVTVTLTQRGGKTELTLHQTALESVARRTGAYPSWLSMLDRLAEQLRLA